MKAYLCGYGFTLENLRKFGYDLTKTLNVSISSGLNVYFAISENDKKAIFGVNEYYKNKGFEYMVKANKSYPKIDTLISFNEKLLAGIKQFCFDQKTHHIQKRIERGQ